MTQTQRLIKRGRMNGPNCKGAMQKATMKTLTPLGVLDINKQVEMTKFKKFVPEIDQADFWPPLLTCKRHRLGCPTVKYVPVQTVALFVAKIYFESILNLAKNDTCKQRQQSSERSFSCISRSSHV
jgi:hypothetical protein